MSEDTTPSKQPLIMLYAGDALKALANLPEVKVVRVQVTLKSGKQVVVEGVKGVTL